MHTHGEVGTNLPLGSLVPRPLPPGLEVSGNETSPWGALTHAHGMCRRYAHALFGWRGPRSDVAPITERSRSGDVATSQRQVTRRPDSPRSATVVACGGGRSGVAMRRLKPTLRSLLFKVTIFCELVVWRILRVLNFYAFAACAGGVALYSMRTLAR